MAKMTDDAVQLKKLYALLERVKKETLGADYQKRIEMKELQSKIEEKILAMRMTTNV